MTVSGIAKMTLAGTPGVWLLHAIAAEVDKREATVVPGAKVCRGCGCRGETIVALDQGRFVDPAWTMDCIRRGWGRSILYSDNRPRPTRAVAPCGAVFQTAVVVLPCSCRTGVLLVTLVAGPGPEGAEVIRLGTRPDTVSLAWLVAYLAEQRTPAFEWPAQWLVDMDQREANGDRSWVAVWWAQFYAWTRGVALDDERLRWALDQASPRQFHPLSREWITINTKFMPAPRVTGLTGCGRITMTSDNVADIGLDVHDHWVYSLTIDEHPVSFSTGHDATLDDIREGLGLALARRYDVTHCHMYRTPDGFTLTLPEPRPGQVPDLERATTFDLASRMMLASTPTGGHWANPWVLGHQPGGLGAVSAERDNWHCYVDGQRRAMFGGRGSRDDEPVYMRGEAATITLNETVRAGLMTPEDALAALVRAGVLTDDEPVIP
jgi:hypothetical protein